MLDKVLTINKQKYLVSETIKYNNIDYYFLINMNDSKDFKYCYINNNKLFEVTDNTIIGNIALEFAKNNN